MGVLMAGFLLSPKKRAGLTSCVPGFGPWLLWVFLSLKTKEALMGRTIASSYHIFPTTFYLRSIHLGKIAYFILSPILESIKV